MKQAMPGVKPGSMPAPVGVPPAIAELLTRVDALSDDQLRRVGVEWVSKPVGPTAMSELRAWVHASAIRNEWLRRVVSWSNALVEARFAGSPEWKTGSPILAISVGVQCGTLASAMYAGGGITPEALAEAMRPLHRGLVVKE